MLFALIALPAGVGARAQTQDQWQVVEGYVTAAQSPLSFGVNGKPVTASEETTYQWYGGKGKANASASASAVQVGAYVRINGDTEKHMIVAKSVLIRDDSDRQLKGFGVIEKAIRNGSEPVFEADGYRIHITAATTIRFSGKLNHLSSVIPGDWVNYEGKFNPAGELVAKRVEFLQGITGDKKLAEMNRESAAPDAIPAQARLIDANGKFLGAHGKVRMSSAGGPCGWHRLSLDAALQQRVWRVGMAVVPNYQKRMAPNAAARIRFRFYAVDEPQIRSSLGCTSGLILVPEQVIARLRNDDQLASVIADGVAANLQYQATELFPERYVAYGVAVAAQIAASTNPIALLSLDGIAEPLITYQVLQVLQEQRGRVALALMADAGYDPWAAPEAWRLVTPKKLPRNLNTLPYPNMSGYQIHILSLQYPKTGNRGTALTAHR